MTNAAPSDKAADAAWDKIMEIARNYCLIVQASSGVATLAIPQEQRNAGIRKQTLAAHEMREDEEKKSE